MQNELNVDVSRLWDKLIDLTIKTIISGENAISNLIDANLGSRYNSYELFGIDVLFDVDLKPWLLEVSAVNGPGNLRELVSPRGTAMIEKRCSHNSTTSFMHIILSCIENQILILFSLYLCQPNHRSTFLLLFIRLRRWI